MSFDYLHKNPIATVFFYKSGMMPKIDSYRLYLSMKNIRSVARGQFYLGGNVRLNVPKDILGSINQNHSMPQDVKKISSTMRYSRIDPELSK